MVEKPTSDLFCVHLRNGAISFLAFLCYEMAPIYILPLDCLVSFSLPTDWNMVEDFPWNTNILLRGTGHRIAVISKQ